MTLTEHYNNLLQSSIETVEWPYRNITDKGTHHCYVQEYYNDKFTPLKNVPIKLLELGVEHGYSMDLWLSWFNQGTFVGIDPFQPKTIERFNNIFNCEGLNLDGFIQSTVDIFDDNSFDFIIEDGPHTLSSQIFAAVHWTKKLKSGGYLIIEDLQHPDTDVVAIVDSIRDQPNLQVRFFDLRSKLGRYDDTILEIQKR